MGHFLVPHRENCLLQTVKQWWRETYKNSRKQNWAWVQRRISFEWMLWEGKGKASIAIFLHYALTDHLGWAGESSICPLKIYKLICWQHHQHHLESIICPKRKSKVNCCLQFLTGIPVMRTMSSPHGPEFPKSLSTLTSSLRLLWWNTCSSYITKFFYYFSCKKKSKNFSSYFTSPFAFSAKRAFLTSIIIAGKNLTKYITAAFALVVSLCLLTPIFSNQDLYWGLKRENTQKQLFLGFNQSLVLFF